jgi:hypothetical protein
MHFIFFETSFKFIGFASPAGGLRNCNPADGGTPFDSAKKYAPHFLSSASGVTKPKEAANAVTGEKLMQWQYDFCSVFGEIKVIRCLQGLWIHY